MKVGMIGAGLVAKTIASYATAAGHSVVFTSRGAPTPDAIAASDLVVLAVPWPSVAVALSVPPLLAGKILVDATNAFAKTSPRLVLADLGGRSSSEIVAALATGARVVKAFNSITMEHFAQGPRRGDARRVLLVAGDDGAAKKVVISLIESFGFATIDMGDLATGRLSQAGGPLTTGADLLIGS